MLKARFGFLLLLAMAAFAHYATESQSAIPLSEDGSSSARTMPSTPLRAPASSQAKTFAGGCLAYLPEPQGTVRPEDEGKGEAARVLDAFRNVNASSGSKGNSLAGARFAMVLAPDPIHTNLGLFFDRKIVAIQQAAQDAGYDFDSAWLPWRRNTGQNLNNLTDRQRAVSLDLRRESCPGILLFRGHEKPSDSAYANALVVFVIGEQPTGGLNVRQWDNALQALKMLQARPHSSPAPQKPDSFLRILGPTFSGTFDSLARKVDQIATAKKDKPSFSHILMLSGSATSYTEIVKFRDHLESLGAKENKWGLQFSFGTFNENDELHISRFLKYLETHTKHRREVAILSEDETAYARNTFHNPDSSAQSNSKLESEEDAPLDLKYPRDISVIRDAYQKQSVFDSALPKGNAARSILRTGSSSAIGEGLDSLPGYGEDISALDQEARLFAVLDHLRVHHIRYVILRSTNPLDLLFLARFFHRAYPEGRIVTIGSDLLFRREIDTNDFRGMMALSTYPLLPRAPDWRGGSVDGKEQPHQVFTGNTSEGDYMAARYLLQAAPQFSDPPGQKGKAVDPLLFNTDTGKDDRDLPTYANPYWFYPKGTVLSNANPPTWLTTLGRDGYWPVAVLDALSDKRPSSIVQLKTPTSPATSLQLNAPLSAEVCLALAFILAFYQLWGVWGAKLATSDDLFFVFTNNPLIPLQPYLRGFNSALAIMPFVELGMPRWILLGKDMSRWDFAQIVIAFFLAMFTGGRLLKPNFSLGGRPRPSTSEVGSEPDVPSFRDLKQERQTAREKASLTYLGTLAVMLAAYAVPFIASDPLTESYPLVYRMEHVTDGVSPLLPVLLMTLGFYLWTWQAMAGNLMVGAGRPVLPSPEPRPKEVKNAFNDVDTTVTGSTTGGIFVGLRHRWKIWTEKTYLRILGLADCQSSPKESWRRIRVDQYRLSQGLGKIILLMANPFHLFSISSLTIIASAEVVFYLYFNSITQTMSLEGFGYNVVVGQLLLTAIVLTLVEAFHLFSTWVQLRRLLLALGRSRISLAMVQLAPISATSLWTVSTNVHRVQYRLFFQQHEALKRLVNLYGETGTDDCLLIAKERGQVVVNASRSQLGQGVAALWWRPFRDVSGNITEERNIRVTFADAAAYLMNQILFTHWESEHSSLYSRESGAAKNLPSLTLTTHQHRISAAEEFISAHYIAFIHNIIARMRTMTMSMALIFATICFALSSYTFMPRPYISAVLLVNFAIIGSTVAYVYAGMDRNEILSSIANTAPGRLGSEFWVKLTGFLIGPVIGILATQYPSIFDAVIGWIQPGINAVK